jgi:hypothetical protein
MSGYGPAVVTVVSIAVIMVSLSKSYTTKGDRIVEEGVAIRNGRLTVPLYHGTSSLFYDSIVETGLGGRNVVQDLGVRDAARLLVELSKNWRCEDDWLLDIDCCEHIAKEPSDEGFASVAGFNFRYGGTYLSPSRDTAIRYALLNSYGSEALTCTLSLYRRLSHASPDLPALSAFSSLTALELALKKPILVEAVDVALSQLRAEQGGGHQRALAQIEWALEDPDLYDAIVAQANFELIQALPPKQLRFYEIRKREGTGELPELTPIGRRLYKRKLSS